MFPPPPFVPTPPLSTPIVSSNVIALMFNEARIASLSASVGSSLDGTFADRIQHMSQRLTLTARKSARLSGEPWKIKRNVTTKYQSTFFSSDNEALGRSTTLIIYPLVNLATAVNFNSQAPIFMIFDMEKHGGYEIGTILVDENRGPVKDKSIVQSDELAR